MISNEPEKIAAPEFRVDVKLRDVLLNQPGRQGSPKPGRQGSPKPGVTVEEGLPEPIYPQYSYPRWETERKFHNAKAWRTWKSLGRHILNIGSCRANFSR